MPAAMARVTHFWLCQLSKPLHVGRVSFQPVFNKGMLAHPLFTDEVCSKLVCANRHLDGLLAACGPARQLNVTHEQTAARSTQGTSIASSAQHIRSAQSNKVKAMYTELAPGTVCIRV